MKKSLLLLAGLSLSLASTLSAPAFAADAPASDAPAATAAPATKAAPKKAHKAAGPRVSCKDGTTTRSKTKAGACSHHGGVA